MKEVKPYMNGQRNILDTSMSLHVIKDRMQLKFVKEQTDFIAKNLETLIRNTESVAPVRKTKRVRKRKSDYGLVREYRHDLTRSDPPDEKHWAEKHWEEAIFRKWERDENGLDLGIPFRKIVSYQVMLRDTNQDRGWGELDLLGATAENIPVAIELKVNPSEYLLRAIIEVLAYGVAIRKAWSATDECPLCSQWGNIVGKVDTLRDLPLVVMAPASYWDVIFSNSPKRIGFQTPEPVRQSIKSLLGKMSSANYPLTFVEVKAEQQSDKSGPLEIVNAVVKDMPIPSCSSKEDCQSFTID